MTPKDLYFSTKGRIGPRTFWRAVVVLLAVQVVERLVQIVMPLALAEIYIVISLVLLVAFLVAFLVAYLSVYAKRLHDAGRGASWFALCALAFVFGSAILVFYGLQFFATDVVEAYREYFEAVSIGNSGSVELEILVGEMEENQFALFAVNLASLFITNFVIGAIVARLPSEPGSNRFGPPEGGGNPDVFD